MVNCLCAFLYKIWPAGRRPKPPPSPSLPATEPTRPSESSPPSSNMAETTRLSQRTSSLVSETRFEYDVFLSFRGEDTRHGFTKHIYEELVRMQVRTFFDNEELETGDKIGDRLSNAIKGSEIFVPIFSVRYADSRWCLMELADIVKCNRLIIPVFLHVNPVDVQKQEGTYGSPLPGFMGRFGEEKVKEWKEALRVAGKAPGFTLDDDRDEEGLIEKVIRKIMEELKNPPLALPKHLIGTESKVQDVMKLLDVDANDVRMVAIHGKQGIGKTTLAKEIYNKIFLKFDAFFFFPGVKEASRTDGLASLHKQLICGLLKVKEEPFLSDVDKGKNAIKEKVSKGSVFIVLDDVSDKNQLDALVGDKNWFRPGSRIIITTEDDSFLDSKMHKKYSPKELDDEEALQLFCYHAFGKMAPPEEYFRLSKQAVALCHGLPKALEKLGSFLSDKTSEDEWDDMLNKLERSLPNAILHLFSARTRNKMATNGKGKKLGETVGESRPSNVTKFDVIVSFSGGEEAIDAFTDLLYSALLRDGISACRSNGGDDAPEGERLREAPDGLGICVLILSVSYAASERCLTELGWMVEQRRLIFPVFFDVNPSDVRRQKGALERPFRRHDERLDRELVSGWKKALEEVGGTKGYDLTVEESGQEAKLVQLIVRDVLKKLSNAPRSVAKYPIGIDSRVEEMLSMLDLKANDFRMVGIAGMGGIGKTTLANAVYNQIFSLFDSSIFISDVREMSKQPKGLVTLQNKLFGGIFDGKISLVNNVSEGIGVIRDRMHSKKVLIVLDDVDCKEQLDALIGDRDWFKKGSRIIITTRDQHVLHLHKIKEHEIYWPKTLYFDDALHLFSYHAFGRNCPLEQYQKLSEDVVRVIDGLPLALEVIGSSLFDKRNREDWKDVIRKLERVPFDDVQERLKISYDGLDVFEKQIFLDTACFFIGMDQEDAIHIWRGCEFFPSITVKVLMHKSLIKVGSGNLLEMHDQLRDMGRAIVQSEDHQNVGNQSRLWSQDEVLDVFNNFKGTQRIEGIILNLQENGGAAMAKKNIQSQAFSALHNLRLLRINYVSLIGRSKILPSKLKWLEWHGCPLKSLPQGFKLNNVVVLDLSDSHITHVWKGPSFCRRKVIDKIKVLNLGECRQLIVTPNFSRHPGLVKLVLEKCQSLVKIHKSIVVLKDLVSLKLRGCTSLEKVPKEICSLHKLKFLDIANCGKINKLPRNLGKMESLLELHIDGTAIKEVPASMLLLKSLSHLSLNSCWLLKNLPDAIGELVSLKELELDGTEVDKIPSSIGSLKKLEKLSARQCKCLSILPHSIGDTKNLKMLLLDGTIIEQLPDSVGSLENLNRLTLKKCKQLKHLPVSMGQLKALNHLYLPETSVTELSEDFGMLSTLTILDMKKCECIKELPTTFGGLKELKNLCLRSNCMLTMLPTSFSLLSSLKELDASRCNLMESAIPNDFGNLTSLVSLKLGYNKFCSLPNSMRNLTQLKNLYVENCTELRSLLHLPSSLVHLDAKHCVSLNSICDLSDMENLEELALTNCSKLDDVIGLENLKALRFLYIDCCRHLRDACKSRLVKGIFENLKYFSIPGNDIPRCLMYNQSFCEIPKLSTSTIKIKGLILCFVYVIIEEPANGYPDIPGIVDIQIMIMVDGKEIFRSTLIIHGIPKPNQNQIYYCHYNERDKVALFLEDGGRIEVLKRSRPYIEGIQIKKVAFHVFYKQRDQHELMEGLQAEMNELVENSREEMIFCDLAKGFRSLSNSGSIKNTN
ncbi:disease resistance protein RUN1-like [Nymphaea colorata]|nr:disease resistance protein RUN1-like [Nymphaea colorata]